MRQGIEQHARAAKRAAARVRIATREYDKRRSSMLAAPGDRRAYAAATKSLKVLARHLDTLARHSEALRAILAVNDRRSEQMNNTTTPAQAEQAEYVVYQDDKPIETLASLYSAVATHTPRDERDTKGR